MKRDLVLVGSIRISYWGGEYLIELWVKRMLVVVRVYKLEDMYVIGCYCLFL